MRECELNNSVSGYLRSLSNDRVALEEVIEVSDDPITYDKMAIGAIHLPHLLENAPIDLVIFVDALKLYKVHLSGHLIFRGDQ